MPKLSSSIFMEPVFQHPSSAWNELIPAAFFLVEQLKPSVFVELGTYSGCSYFSFCQAIAKYNTGTRAFAVDTWTGDPHSGNYGNDVYEFVARTNKNHFSDFSNLLHMDFDSAAGLFENSSIDLLHIDGYHTYERVKHDFETWLPKMSPKGVVLFHDTRVRETNFGVWRLMDELKTQYPFFELEHGYGLGMLCTGGSTDPSFLDFIASSANDDFVQQVFQACGKLITEKTAIQRLQREMLQAMELLDAEKRIRRDLAVTLESKNHETQNLQNLVHRQEALLARLETRLQEFEGRLLCRLAKRATAWLDKVPGIQHLRKGTDRLLHFLLQRKS